MTTLLFQATQADGPGGTIGLILASTPETKVVLVICAVMSLVSWGVIVVKWLQLRKVNRLAERFFADVERAPKLADAYRLATTQKPSPYQRLFREGIHFLQDVRPGALSGDTGAPSMSTNQLDALKLVLGKEVQAEREGLSRFIPWLATIGATGPLLGLLGTVLGVMDAFLGIATHGSGNIGAVAPGVAEALIATAAGLLAAIPAVICYNIFTNRVRIITGELQGFAQDLIGTMAREGLL